MADNYQILDANGDPLDIASKDVGGGVKANRVYPQVDGADVSAANPVPVEAASLPLPDGAATEASLLTQTGQQGTGLNPPSGGSGVLGFLSGIYSRLSAVVLGAGSAVIGAVTQSGNWTVRLADGSGNNVTSAARGSERALTVQVVGSDGTQVTSFGGGGGATTARWALGSQTTVLDTGLNSLANNSLAISNAYDNTAGSTGDGYTLCDLELVATYGTNPSANTGVSVWLLQSQDGTNYEDGGTSVTPARAPDAVLPLRAVTTAQRVVAWSVPLPPGFVKVLAKNDGTGQAMASSGNTLKLRPSARRSS